jgi:hypothetical protein
MKRTQAVKSFENVLSACPGPSLADVHAALSIKEARSVHRFEYSGSLFKAIDGTHPDPEKRWNTLNEAKQDELWLDEFRMHKETLDELYHLCEPHLPHSTFLTAGHLIQRIECAAKDTSC